MAKSRNPILSIQETLEFLEIKSAYGLQGVGAVFMLLKKLSDNKGALPLSILPAIANEINFDRLHHLVADHGIFHSDHENFWYPPICPKPPKPTQQQQDDFSGYDERTVKSFTTFRDIVAANYPRVAAMEQPFTIEQYLKICKISSKDAIIEVLAAMNNYKQLHSKYVSAYLTTWNWLKQRSNNHAINEADKRLQQAVSRHTGTTTG